MAASPDRAKRGPWTWTDQFSHYTSGRSVPNFGVSIHDPKSAAMDFEVLPSVQSSEYSIMKNQAHPKCVNQLNAHRLEQFEDLTRQIEGMGGAELFKDSNGERVTRFLNDTSLLLKIGMITQVTGAILGHGHSAESNKAEEKAGSNAPPSMLVTFFNMNSVAGGLENQRSVRVMLGEAMTKQPSLTGLFPGAMVAVVADILKKNEDFLVTMAMAHKVMLPSMPSVPWLLPPHLKNALNTTRPATAAAPKPSLMSANSTKLRVQVCRGPFLRDTKITQAILTGVVRTALQRTADLLIILGPFVEAATGSAMDPIPNMSYEETLEDYLDAIEETLPDDGCRLQVVLVPSPDDVTLTPVMPQLGFNFSSNHDNVHFATNPCTISMCGGIRLSVGGFDSVNHINDCYFEKPKKGVAVGIASAGNAPSSRQQRILSSLMRNQVFVPILLGNTSCYSQVDYSLYNRTRMTQKVQAQPQMIKAENNQEEDAIPAAAPATKNSDNQKAETEACVSVCPHILVVPSSGKPWAGRMDAVEPEDGKGALALVAGTMHGLAGSATALHREGKGWALPISELTVGSVEKLKFEGFTEESHTAVQTLLLEVKE